MTVRGGFNTGCGLMLSILAAILSLVMLWIVLAVLVKVAA